MQWVLNIAIRDGFLKYSDVLLLLSIPVTQIFLILFFLFMKHYSKQPRAFREELRMIFHGYTRSIHFVCKA